MGGGNEEMSIKGFHSVQFSRSVMSDSLWAHGLQQPRPPCPSPTPRACSNSLPLRWWCHPTISSSVVPFSSRLQSFPASGCFHVSQFFVPGGQSIGTSAWASVLPMYIQDWFPLELTGLISLQSKGLSFTQLLIQFPKSKLAHKIWPSHFPYPSLFHDVIFYSVSLIQPEYQLLSPFFLGYCSVAKLILLSAILPHLTPVLHITSQSDLLQM